MRFFIAMILVILTGCSIVFGFKETLTAIYVDNTILGIFGTICIIVYIILSMNRDNYAR